MFRTNRCRRAHSKKTPWFRLQLEKLETRNLLSHSPPLIEDFSDDMDPALPGLASSVFEHNYAGPFIADHSAAGLPGTSPPYGLLVSDLNNNDVVTFSGQDVDYASVAVNAYLQWRTSAVQFVGTLGTVTYRGPTPTGTFPPLEVPFWLPTTVEIRTLPAPSDHIWSVVDTDPAHTGIDIGQITAVVLGGDGLLFDDLTIHLTSTPPGNSPPDAHDDEVFAAAGVPLDIGIQDLFGNDSDPDGDALTIANVLPAGNGSAVLNGSVITYMSNPGFLGTDTFSYIVDDGHGGQDTATVTVVLGRAVYVEDFSDDTDPSRAGFASAVFQHSDADVNKLTDYSPYLSDHSSSPPHAKFQFLGHPPVPTDVVTFVLSLDEFVEFARVEVNTRFGPGLVEFVGTQGTICYISPGEVAPPGSTVIFSLPSQGNPDWVTVDTRVANIGQITEIRLSGGEILFDDLLIHVQGAPPPPDTDRDGVTDEIEDAHPNTVLIGGVALGDGNRDGSPDSVQDFVTSLPNAVDGQYVTIESPSGTQLIDVRARDIPPPVGVELPVGAFEYTIDGITSADGSAVVTIFLPPLTTIDSFYKYGVTSDDSLIHWFEFGLDSASDTGAEILDDDADGFADRIVIHFVDGGRGDSDLLSNGKIVDPAAPAHATGMASGEIHGTKFHDVDGDGIFDPGEPALPGWTIFLDVNQNSALDPLELSTVTDQFGHYSFTGLDRRTHTVVEQQQLGWRTTAPATFEEQVIKIGGIPRSVTVGDLNKDRYDDLVAVVNDFDDYDVGVFFNNRDGTFTLHSELVAGGAPEAVALADFNSVPTIGISGFQHPDLAVSSTLGHHVVAFLGTSNSVFERVETGFPVGEEPFGIVSADFDLDNKIDLMTADFDSDTISFLKGHDDGTFAAAVTIPVDGDSSPEEEPNLLREGPVALVAGQFNASADLFPDVAVANWESVSIFLGNGLGQFSLAQTIPLGGGSTLVGAITTGQFNPNQDAFADLAVAIPDSDSLALLLGMGDGQFQLTTLPAGDRPASVVAIRLDEDAIDDLAVAKLDSSSVMLLIGAGDGTFTRVLDRIVTDRPYHLAVGDLDQNGYSDLATANRSDGTISVLMANPRQVHMARLGNSPVVRDINFGNVSLYDGVIRGMRWEDLDGDGSRGSFEPELSFRSVYLDVNNDGIRQPGVDRSTTTDAFGRYEFINVPPGDYRVIAVSSTGAGDEIQTFPADGVHFITLAAGEQATGLDFGSQFSPGTIRGYVWDDLNGNGVRDNADGDAVFDEPVQSGVTVYLDQNENGLRDADEPMRVTSDVGEYSFVGVSRGHTYVIAEEIPTGYAQTSPGFEFLGVHYVNLGGYEIAFADFGNGAEAELRGNKFVDDDGDGQRDPGELGVAGANIFVDTNRNFRLDPGEPSALTDADGNYLIGQVTPGSWTVLDAQTLVALPANDSHRDFGFSVAASPTHLVVGDPLAVDMTSGSSDVAGFAGVYRRMPAGPIAINSLNPGGPAFGFSVAVTGDRVLVGKPGLNESRANGLASVFGSASNLGTSSDVGSVAVFDIPSGLHDFSVSSQDYYHADGSYMGTLDAGISLAVLDGEQPTFFAGGGGGIVSEFPFTLPNHELRVYSNNFATFDDFFGESVAAAGDFVLVGAPGDDERANDGGAAYLFHHDVDCDCHMFPLQVFFPPVPEIGDNFGVSVAVLGDSFLIGAPAANLGANSAGAAYLYNQSDEFVNVAPLQIFQNPSPGSNDYFGFSLAMVGNKVVIGAPRDDTMAVDAGAVYVFDAANGHLLDRLYSPNPRAGAQFGFSLATVADEAILVGEPSPNVLLDPGAAYLFPIVEPVAIMPGQITTVAFIVRAESPDADGVDNSVEDNAPHEGDGNSDGFLDSQQANVASLPAALGGGYLTLASAPGTRLVDVHTFEGFAPSDDGPYAFDTPVGLVGFTLERIPVGGSDIVELILHSSPVIDSYYKFGQTPDNPTPHVYAFMFDGTLGTLGAELINEDADPGIERIRLHLADGQLGDDDLTANGVITDPGGPVLVIPPNNAPIAINDTAVVTEDSSENAIDVLSNDVDVNGDTLSVDAFDVVSEAGGAVHCSVVGDCTYAPAPNSYGIDSFTYTVSDGHGETATGIVRVTVSEVNDAPTASDDVATLSEDGGAHTIDVLGNDSAGPINESGQTLTVTQASALHGSVTINLDGTLSYSPNVDYFGSDTITYTVRDNGTTRCLPDPLIATAVVIVTVTEVNDAPIAATDSTPVAENDSVTVHVLANDQAGPTNESGQLLTPFAASAAHGAVSIHDNGTLTYTPAAGYSGWDKITYQIRDNGTTDGAPDPLTATGFVAVTVTPLNNAPILDPTVISNASQCGGVVPQQLVSVSVGFTDSDGALDSHKARIDWGDGSSTIGAVSESNGAGTVTGTHPYIAGGVYTVVIALKDSRGAWDFVSHTVVITGASVQNGVLRIIGGDEADHVSVNQQGNDSFKVHADFFPNGNSQTFPMAEVTRIVVLACGDDDDVSIAGNIDTRSLIDGGAGNDHLNGGRGPNIILGGAGNDHLHGGSARNVMIGGTGADRLDGNGGDDLLIGGRTAFDIDDDHLTNGSFDTALHAVLAEWNSTRSYAARVANLRGTGSGPRLNGANLLKNDVTVFDDLAADVMTGSADQDWFFFQLGQDHVTDAKSNEAVN